MQTQLNIHFSQYVCCAHDRTFFLCLFVSCLCLRVVVEFCVYRPSVVLCLIYSDSTDLLITILN